MPRRVQCVWPGCQLMAPVKEPLCGEAGIPGEYIKHTVENWIRLTRGEISPPREEAK